MVKRIVQKLRAAGTGAVSRQWKRPCCTASWLARTLIGISERDVPTKDSRFADPAWHENPVYRRVAQSYLAFCDSVDRLAGDRPLRCDRLPWRNTPDQWALR
jgi:hypothetical protein